MALRPRRISQWWVTFRQSENPLQRDVFGEIDGRRLMSPTKSAVIPITMGRPVRVDPWVSQPVISAESCAFSGPVGGFYGYPMMADGSK